MKLRRKVNLMTYALYYLLTYYTCTLSLQFYNFTITILLFQTIFTLLCYKCLYYVYIFSTFSKYKKNKIKYIQCTKKCLPVTF